MRFKNIGWHGTWTIFLCSEVILCNEKAVSHFHGLFQPHITGNWNLLKIRAGNWNPFPVSRFNTETRKRSCSEILNIETGNGSRFDIRQYLNMWKEILPASKMPTVSILTASLTCCMQLSAGYRNSSSFIYRFRYIQLKSAARQWSCKYRNSLHCQNEHRMYLVETVTVQTGYNYFLLIFLERCSVHCRSMQSVPGMQQTCHS